LTRTRAKIVQLGKGKVRFSILKEEGTARDNSYVLLFEGNNMNKVSERWKRRLATRREVKVIRANMHQQE